VPAISLHGADILGLVRGHPRQRVAAPTAPAGGGDYGPLTLPPIFAPSTGRAPVWAPNATPATRAPAPAGSPRRPTVRPGSTAPARGPGSVIRPTSKPKPKRGTDARL